MACILGDEVIYGVTNMFESITILFEKVMSVFHVGYEIVEFKEANIMFKGLVSNKVLDK